MAMEDVASHANVYQDKTRNRTLLFSSFIALTKRIHFIKNTHKKNKQQQKKTYRNASKQSLPTVLITIHFGVKQP